MAASALLDVLSNSGAAEGDDDALPSTCKRSMFILFQEMLENEEKAVGGANTGRLLPLQALDS